MADGIDGAADAFRSEIAPESAPSRERDTGGRFVAKEHMFSPRPIEGDEITGDTSDGGDDVRLRERERREADGRTEQRDAPQNNAARARRAAANDNQREANDNEPPEQIGEGPEDEGDADEKPDDGAEDAEEVGPKYEVTVDGQPVEVTLQEALKGYVREATFHSRMHKVAEAARAVEQEAQQTVQAKERVVQELEYLHLLIGSLSPPQPNWDQEFQANPAAAHEKLKAHAAIQGQMQWAAEQLQRKQAMAAADYDKAAEKYANEQFPIFVREANIQDEKTLDDKITLIRNYLKFRKFNEGEIATTYDNRMMLVALDAAMYHQGQNAELPKPVQPGAGRALAPGASTPHTRNAGRRSIDEAMNKLAKSGHIDDATTVFQRLLR